MKNVNNGRTACFWPSSKKKVKAYFPSGPGRDTGPGNLRRKEKSGGLADRRRVAKITATVLGVRVTLLYSPRWGDSLGVLRSAAVNGKNRDGVSSKHLNTSQNRKAQIDLSNVCEIRASHPRGT
eukprot:scaffold23169_cov30-Tisochrysis_lutea.AAC.1